MMKLIYLLIITLTASIGVTQTKIKLSDFPDRTVVWGPHEYDEVRFRLQLASLAKIPLPEISDEYYKPFFTQLFNTNYLKVFTNQSISPKERFKLVEPLYETLPKISLILAKGGRENEAIEFTRFTMEAMLQNTYLFKDMMNTTTEKKKVEFIQSIKNEKGFYQSIHGVIGMLSYITENNKRYQLSLATWCSNNFPILWEWMDEEDQIKCINELKILSEESTSKEMSAISKQILSKLKTQ